MPEIDSRILDQFQRACPAAYRALAGRKFLLPNRCQASYSSQDVALHRRQLVLLVSTLSPKEDSIPLRSELINLVQSLRCDFPTIFLDLDLGEMLLRTDFTTDDVHWPWPGLRIMLPKELALNADSESCPLQYVDVCVAAQGEPIRFPQELLDDLFGGLAKIGCTPNPYLLRGFTHPEAGECYGCALSYSLETATWANRWETRRLQELARTETAPDSSEHANVESVRKLVLNVLLLLTHYELDPILVEGTPLIRRAKMKGRHFLAELARARFLSELLRKKAFRRVKPVSEAGEEEIGSISGESVGESTGIKRRSH